MGTTGEQLLLQSSCPIRQHLLLYCFVLSLYRRLKFVWFNNFYTKIIYFRKSIPDIDKISKKSLP
jgi:hypothetical protein